MVEKREKQKRELIKARESVFLKELEIVGDTSGKMSSDDIRWAQSCCRKDFTEYETLQTLDLNYRRKPKTYKKLSKRRRRRIKQNSTVLNSTEEEVLSSGDISDKSVETEGKTYCDRSDLGESSSMYSTTNVSQNLVDENTGQKSAISNETVSDKGHNEKDASGETCCASSQRISKRLEDLSSDSDFEDESLRNTKLRSARRQRIEHLQSQEESKQKNEITRSEGVKCGSPGQSNSRLNGVRVAFSKDATTGLVPVKNFKTSGEIKQNVLRSSKRIVGRTYNGNRKRLFADLSRKIENSEKRSERVLRSSAGMLDGQMILDKFDIFLSPKRFCHRNGVVGSPKNDENADQNRNLRHAERLSDETPKVISEESVRTRSRCRRVDSGSPISSSTRRDSGFSENVSVHPNNSSYKPCDALKESLADRCRTCRSPGKLSENSMKNSSTSFSNSRECSQFFGKFRRTAATSA